MSLARPARSRPARRPSLEERQRGDYQTPPELADAICAVVEGRLASPRLILEPTCGAGSLLLAAARRFPGARLFGVELDRARLAQASAALEGLVAPARVKLLGADIFDVDLAGLIGAGDEPLLVLGNPPWITAAEMARIGGHNLPVKRNLRSLSGYEAVTGASNFDLAESILISILISLQGRAGQVAMLCKRAVARKVVEFAARRGLALDDAWFYSIDAARWFDAAVDAGLFCFSTAGGKVPRSYGCQLAELDRPGVRTGAFGVAGDGLVSDPAAYERWGEVALGQDGLAWRSGIKHDCARVMVLERGEDGEALRNGLGEEVRLEPTCLFPLLKGTDLHRGRVTSARHLLLVPQRRVGEETASLVRRAPSTWAYLEGHRSLLEARASSIYRGKPPFSIFGVGPYTFSPWKVAVSGLHGEPRFRLVGPLEGAPVVFDDTCYFLSFAEEGAARAARALLETRPARELLGALLFRDAKRPVTRALLERLHLGKLARWAREQGEAPGLPAAELAVLLALTG